MDREQLILNLKSKLEKNYDKSLILSLIYLNDEDSFIDAINNDRPKTGRYFPSEDYINIIGKFKCKNYIDSVSILVDMIENSNADIAIKASNALIEVINRINNIEELLPLTELLDLKYVESISLGSLNRRELGFDVLRYSKNVLIKSFLLNYSNAKYSDKDKISFSDIAKILPYVDYDHRLVNTLITHLKECKHSYTIEIILKTLGDIENKNLMIEEQFCQIIVNIIKNDFKYVDGSDKSKVKEYAFIALGNICDEKLLPFLVESLDNDHLKEFVPFAFKKMQNRDVLI